MEELFATERLIPRAELTLDVKTYSNRGSSFFERAYEFGLLHGETCYAVKILESACKGHDGRIEELRNTLIHRLLFDLMMGALNDVATTGTVMTFSSE